MHLGYKFIINTYVVANMTQMPGCTKRHLSFLTVSGFFCIEQPMNLFMVIIIRNVNIINGFNRFNIFWKVFEFKLNSLLKTERRTLPYFEQPIQMHFIYLIVVNTSLHMHFIYLIIVYMRLHMLFIWLRVVLEQNSRHIFKNFMADINISP